MQRNYLGRRRLTVALALAGATIVTGQAPWGHAAALFEAQPVDASRFTVLARPVGQEDWTLLVLEQIRRAPLCWQTRSDGLVDPSLNRFDYTGICGRYIDSNAYSLRFGDGGATADGSAGLRLRLAPLGGELQLQASSPDLAGILVVGRAPLPARVRDGFVAIRLEPGWELKRRSYGGQLLNHLYFSNASGARELLAQASTSSSSPPTGRRLGASGRGFPPLAPPPPPPPLTADLPDSRENPPMRQLRRRPINRLQPPATTAPLAGELLTPAEGSRVIALQVIPFQE